MAVMLVLLKEGIYEPCHWDGFRCHDIHTKFHKIGPGIQKLLGGDTYKDTGVKKQKSELHKGQTAWNISYSICKILMNRDSHVN
jgi:hypothetical protein